MSDDELPSLKELLSRVSSNNSAASGKHLPKLDAKESESPVDVFFRTAYIYSFFKRPSLGKRATKIQRLDENVDVVENTDLNECLPCKPHCHPNNLPVFIHDRASDMLIPGRICHLYRGKNSKINIYKVEKYDGSNENVHEKYIITEDNRLFYSGRALPLETARRSRSLGQTRESVDLVPVVREHEDELIAIAKGQTSRTRDSFFFKDAKLKASLYSCTGRGLYSISDHDALSKYLCTDWLNSIDSETMGEIQKRFESNSGSKTVTQFKHLFQQYLVLVIVPEIIIIQALSADPGTSREQVEDKMATVDKDATATSFVEYLYAARSLVRWSHQNQ